MTINDLGKPFEAQEVAPDSLKLNVICRLSRTLQLSGIGFEGPPGSQEGLGRLRDQVRRGNSKRTPEAWNRLGFSFYLIFSGLLCAVSSPGHLAGVALKHSKGQASNPVL